ncbi:3-oxoacid CoA-transferase subunit B [Cumulibacter soli]|uniref:3-oxoacid CoA-transferase subunit B n=1 Tax=Cumulibacter soli TaxID=2546344 RepID=UPI001ABBCD6D|nr:3-oxoacid CoA-transferase subunit B [Cumulibacter soli]
MTTSPTRPGWTPQQIAARIAADIPDGSYVNLGIGRPTEVANALPADREILLHSENGILGMGPAPAAGDEDWDLINAGKQPVTLLTGGSYFHHTDSFMIMRGGHLDVSVLGAFEVAVNGDLANWSTGNMSRLPGVGGAMDLAVGAKSVYVSMTHNSPTGVSKLVETCSYPLTATNVVDRVYTELGVFSVDGAEFTVLDLAPGVTFEHVRSVTDAPLCS